MFIIIVFDKVFVWYNNNFGILKSNGVLLWNLCKFFWGKILLNLDWIEKNIFVLVCWFFFLVVFLVYCGFIFVFNFV